MVIGRSFMVGVGVAAGIAATTCAPARAETQTFVVMANGEKVGHLDADVQPAAVSVDYGVVNNGRGAKAKEQIALNADGVPVHWTIEGTSLFGSAVHETFDWKAGAASWAGQADKGALKAPKALFYAAADASPWIQGQYARALLKAPGHTLPVLPSGSMRLDEVKKLTVGEGPHAVPVTLYELGGLELNPTMIALDDKGNLFALPGEGLVRAGYEGELKTLSRVGRDLALERAEAAQAKLA
ncbi:MAG TPA: hypothetical protein VGH86_08250, partial [Phenylobacterium sp.]